MVSEHYMFRFDNNAVYPSVKIMWSESVEDHFFTKVVIGADRVDLLFEELMNRVVNESAKCAEHDPVEATLYRNGEFFHLSFDFPDESSDAEPYMGFANYHRKVYWHIYTKEVYHIYSELRSIINPYVKEK